MDPILKLIRVILVVDVGIVVFTLLEKRGDWFWSTQLALLSSLLIVVGSMVGYRRLVEKRVELGERGKEPISGELSDKWGLWEEEKEEEGKKELSKETEVNRKKRKPSLWDKLSLGIGGAFTPLRILGYLALVISFFALQKKGLFSVVPFLFGVSLPPAILFGLGIAGQRRQK
jgi:hypothetical protein